MRDKLLHKIKRKQAEIQGLRDDVVRIQDKIKLEESYLRGLEDTQRLMDQLNKYESGLEPKFGFVLKEGSDLAKVRDVILAAGKPLHVKEIMALMGKPFDPKTRASLVGSLGQYVRSKKIFTRPGRNIFGLIEMVEHGKKELDTESEESEPAISSENRIERVRLIR